MIFGRILLIALGGLIGLAPSLMAQTFFIEKANAKGVNHFYLSGEYMGGGAAWFDYDNDGDEDIWITGGSNLDQLFQNQGDGTFIQVGGAAGLSVTSGYITNGVVTGDIDNDGDRDVYVTTSKSFHNHLFQNNGDGTFTDISVAAGLDQDSAWSTVASFGDVNLDGYLDLYVGNYIEFDKILVNGNHEPVGFDHDCFHNFFYLNNGDGTFTELGQSFGLADSGCALATAFTDYDQDHDVDLLLANDFGEWVVPNKLFRNNQAGSSFTDVSVPAQMDAELYGMGIAVGDYDQDLDLDYYITNLGRNGLFQNQGNGSFLDVTTAAGVEDTKEGFSFTVGWGTSFEDVDNDTDLDLFVTNGHVPAFDFIATNPSNPDRLFINENDGTFTDYSMQAGINYPDRGRGSACADFDQDGDVDWIVVPVNKIGTGEPISKVLLHRNDLNNAHHWLQVKLQGTVNNRDAFGSLIKVVLSDRAWVHEISGGNSHGSQNSSVAHLGLGDKTQVDSLIITWPGGKEQVLTSIAADQRITVVEDSNLYTTAIQSLTRSSFKAYPNPFSTEVRFEYQLDAPQEVRIRLYNMQGQLVRALVHERQAAGLNEVVWDGKDQGGRVLPGGIFIARVRMGDQILSQRILRIEN